MTRAADIPISALPFRLSAPCVEKQAAPVEVEALIAGLSTAKRAAFFELCGGRSAHQIWKENAFRILDQDDGAFIAVFARIARINHSCAPNCHCAWNKRLRRQTIHALRDDGDPVDVPYQAIRMVEALEATQVDEQRQAQRREEARRLHV